MYEEDEEIEVRFFMIDFPMYECQLKNNLQVFKIGSVVMSFINLFFVFMLINGVFNCQFCQFFPLLIRPTDGMMVLGITLLNICLFIYPTLKLYFSYKRHQSSKSQK